MDAFFLLLSLYFSSNAIPQVSPRRESDDVVLYDGRDVHASETWQAFWVKLNRRFPADNRPLESGIAHGSGMKPASEECFARTEASSFRLLSVPLFSWHIAPPWEAIREWIPDDDAPELSIKNLSRLPINVAWLSVSRQKCAMVKPPDLRAYLDEWPYDAEDNVRRTCGSDGRAIILVRTPMGLEHCECDGRPDGQRVHGMGSAFDFHHARIAAARLAGRVDACELSAGDCMVLAQEAAAYHHRMLLLFRLRDWARVERDTERALRLIEFIRLHAWQEEDRVQFDPWRPGVTRIHAVARAMFLLENGRHREACEIARSMGIPGAACDGLSRNTHLGEALLAGVRADLIEHPVHHLKDDALFVRQDDYWVIVYHGQRALLKDTRGMHCLALLLRHPGREFHVSEFPAHLLEASHPPAAPLTNGHRPNSEDHLVTAGLFEGDAMLDAQAKAQFKNRLAELREEHTEAEQRNDPHRATKAREEMDTIARHLASAIGLGGRDRKTSSDAERARCAITKRIKQAVQKIADTIPTLGHHLAARIKTGYFCSYNPHPDRQVAWKC